MDEDTTLHKLENKLDLLGGNVDALRGEVRAIDAGLRTEVRAIDARLSRIEAPLFTRALESTKPDANGSWRQYFVWLLIAIIGALLGASLTGAGGLPL